MEGTVISFSCDGNRGGWYPREASNGDNPVAELTRVLWGYSTQDRCSLQEAGSAGIMHCKAASRS